MSKPYWHCDRCGGNFDHGESCDCKKQETPHEREARLIKENSIYGLNPGRPVLSVSETLILGVDLSREKDISCIQVGRVIGNTRKIINTIYGEEAQKTYDILMNRAGL